MPGAQVRWAGDRCSVCDSDVDFDFDQLVSCDACGITVHQSCYGVAELPGVDDMWLCRACELKVSGVASLNSGKASAGQFLYDHRTAWADLVHSRSKAIMQPRCCCPSRS